MPGGLPEDSWPRSNVCMPRKGSTHSKIALRMTHSTSAIHVPVIVQPALEYGVAFAVQVLARVLFLHDLGTDVSVRGLCSQTSGWQLVRTLHRGFRVLKLVSLSNMRRITGYSISIPIAKAAKYLFFFFSAGLRVDLEQNCQCIYPTLPTLPLPTYLQVIEVYREHAATLSLIQVRDLPCLHLVVSSSTSYTFSATVVVSKANSLDSPWHCPEYY